jgi:CRP-like cAMP-binding protein
LPLRSRLHVITSLWLDLTRRLSLLDQPHQPRFGADISDRLITAAIYLGTIEGHAMTASRIAHHAGLPRTTVLRRLAALEQSGAVERRGLTWRTPLRTELRMERADYDEIATLIRDHAAELE